MMACGMLASTRVQAHPRIMASMTSPTTAERGMSTTTTLSETTTSTCLTMVFGTRVATTDREHPTITASMTRRSIAKPGDMNTFLCLTTVCGTKESMRDP